MTEESDEESDEAEVDICVGVGEPTGILGISVKGERSGSVGGETSGSEGAIMVVVVVSGNVNALRARLRVMSGDGTGIRERREGSLQYVPAAG